MLKYLKNRNLALALSLPLFLGAYSVAEPICELGECPTAKKISALILDWDGALKKVAAASPADREAGLARVNELKKDCPVASRLGETLVAVDAVLAGVIACDESSKTCCPLEKDGVDRTSPAVAEGLELKTARGQILASLKKLTGQSSSACQASCESQTKLTAAGAKSATAAQCDASSQACPVQAAVRLGQLQASWKQATREAKALPLAKRRQLAEGFAALQEDCPVAALMPRTVQGLHEGFRRLGEVHAKMNAWAAAHPEILKDLPEAEMTKWHIRVALLEETRKVLDGVVGTLGQMREGVEVASKR